MRRLVLSFIFATLFFVNSALAVITDMGSASTFSSVQTVTMTSTSAVGSGVLVVVFISDGNTSAIGATVTDSKSNTYILAKNQTGVPSNISMFYSFVASALTTSDTLTYTTALGFGANGMGISAISATGYSTYDSATAASSNNGFAATFTVTGAGSAAVANELYVCWVVANSTPTITGAGTWSTAPPNGISGFAMEAAYQVNSGTSALTCSGTLSAQFASVLIASFKPTAGASVIPGALMPGPAIGVR